MEGFKVRIGCLVMVENLITEIEQYRLTRSQLQKEKELKLRFPMKQIIQNILFVKPLIMILSVFFIFMFHTDNTAETVSFQKRKKIFENKISDIAERYVGVPYKLGGDTEKSWALDNSHLLCLIYYEAANQAGLRFRGYMPMKALLRNTVKVQRDELKNGDLIVLNDGHTALIYKFENRDKFYLIYASLKRKQVISFNSHNVVFEAYWLKNLKGFFRLTERVFVPED